MGGTIGVESVAGRGSTFTFSVVFHRAERRALTRTLPELEGRRVLVVDDDAIAREALSETLPRWKLDVASAASGQLPSPQRTKHVRWVRRSNSC